MKCFDCPLNFKCALWLWDVWNVNWELCSCTDERLVALEQPFYVDLKLLKEYKQSIDKERRIAYNNYSDKKNNRVTTTKELIKGLENTKNKMKNF